VGISLTTLVLGSIAAVVIISLIALYLPSKGDDIVAGNPSDGIEINTSANSFISIFCIFKQQESLTRYLAQI